MYRGLETEDIKSPNTQPYTEHAASEPLNGEVRIAQAHNQQVTVYTCTLSTRSGDGAGLLPVPRRPTTLAYVRAGACCAAGAGWVGYVL